MISSDHCESNVFNKRNYQFGNQLLDSNQISCDDFLKSESKVHKSRQFLLDVTIE